MHACGSSIAAPGHGSSNASTRRRWACACHAKRTGWSGESRSAIGSGLAIAAPAWGLFAPPRREAVRPRGRTGRGTPPRLELGQVVGGEHRDRVRREVDGRERSTGLHLLEQHRSDGLARRQVGGGRDGLARGGLGSPVTGTSPTVALVQSTLAEGRPSAAQHPRTPRQLPASPSRARSRSRTPDAGTMTGRGRAGRSPPALAWWARTSASNRSRGACPPVPRPEARSSTWTRVPPPPPRVRRRSRRSVRRAGSACPSPPPDPTRAGLASRPPG